MKDCAFGNDEMELFKKMEADPENDKDVWQYWSDNRLGNDSIRKIEGWDLFHDQVSSLCNKTLKCKIQSGPGTYIVSMRTATQVNEDTRFSRKVRRVVWEWKKPNGEWGGVYTCADALKLEQAFGAGVQAANLPNPNVDPNVLRIVELGFERANAEAALLAFNNDLERAIDALCSGMPLPGVPGGNVLKIVPTSQGRSLIFHSDGSVAQQGPVALRPLRCNTNNNWEISLDAGWGNIQAQEAALIESTLQTLNLQRSTTVQLSDNSVVLEEVGDMRRVESGSVRGTVLRWELPEQRQDFLREGQKMRRKSFSDSLWMWEENQGPKAGSWVPYDDDVCKQLDTLCQVSGLGASQKGNACYVIDAQAMQQINTNSGYVRKVRAVGWRPIAHLQMGISLSREQIKAIEAAFLLGKRKYVRVQMGGGCCHVSVRDRTYVMIRAPALGGAEVTSAPKGIVRDAAGWRYLDELGVLQRFDAADSAAIDTAHKSLYMLDIGGGWAVDVVKKTLMTVPDAKVVCGLDRSVTPEDCGEGEEVTAADSNAAAAEAAKADSALALEKQMKAAAEVDASKKADLEAQVKTLQEKMKLMEIKNRNGEKERRELIKKAAAAAAAAAEAAAAEQKKVMDEMLILFGAKAPQTAWGLLEIENAQVFATGSFKRVYRAMWRIPHNMSAISALNRQDIGGGGVDQEKRLVALLVPTNGAQVEHEIKILEFLGPHPHIAALLATSLDDKTPANKCMLMEYAGKGSLDTVLADIHDKTKGHINLNSVLLTTAMQVADAMKQLALKNLTHRDLATRNVLVFSYPRSESSHAINDSSNVKVKLTDFGSSIGLPRELEAPGFTPEVIAINRWMAPESLTARREDAVFSERSDVWSFGILLWELWALTATGSGFPYQDVADDEVCKGVINGSLRLKGVRCPSAVDAIMASCFEGDAKKRPKFENLAHSLIQAKAEELKAEENAGNDDDKLCCFCITNPKTMIIQPCGHWCICEDCRAAVTNECPMCRGPVTSIQRLFG